MAEPCAGCGGNLPPLKHQGNPRRYCSRACGDRHKRALGLRLPKPKPCAQCGAHSPRKYCSQKCRDLARRVPCAGCQEPIYLGRGSLPAGEATCRPCRLAGRDGAELKAAQRARVRAAQMSPCIECGQPSFGERCRTCRDALQRVDGRTRSQALKLLQARRNDRDRQAPGPYTQTKRKHLLARWKRQGKTCTYCHAAPAETVDHVLPLAVGGTNYEGNLAPACFDCNRLKQDNLLSAWRYGVKVRKWRVAVEPRIPKTRVRPPIRVVVQTEMRVCPVCSALHVRQKYCSWQCTQEGNARQARDRYRARHGLPVDPSQPTTPTRRIA